MFNVGGHKLSIKTAGIVDRIDPITDAKPANARSLFNNYPGAISPENEGEFGTTVRPPRSISYRVVPDAHPCSVNDDEHLVRTRLWNRKFLEFQHLRRTEAVDCRRLHSRLGRRYFLF